MRVIYKIMCGMADICRNVNYTTLTRRFKGEQQSRTLAVADTLRRLSMQQEELLVGRINKLSDRGLPPTSHIAKNLAEEFIKDVLGKNWVGQFVKRHKDRLKSLYLRNMDNVRVKAEYAPIFKQFYDLVIYHFFIVLSLA
jgi:hypothetical protein